MALFLDSSTLVKLYVQERGSERMTTVVAAPQMWGGLYVSEMALPEVTSALARKVRKGLIRWSSATRALRTFQMDYRHTFDRVPVTTPTFDMAHEELMRHGRRFRLTAADALQLACAMYVSEALAPAVYLFATSDGPLAAVASRVGFEIWDPETASERVLVERHRGLWG